MLSDPDTNSSDLGFQQPVSLSRLIPFELAELETPVNPEAELWIDVKSNKAGRDATWLVRQIAGQSATGKVRLVSQDGATTEMVDLASFEWRWRAPPRRRETRRDVGRPILAMAKYDPIHSDQNSPYAHPRAGDTIAWRPVFERFLSYHSRHLLPRLDELLDKYQGNEKGYYDKLIETYEGKPQTDGPKIALSGQCRICHCSGHWGNECPQRRATPVCRLCLCQGHLDSQCPTQVAALLTLFEFCGKVGHAAAECKAPPWEGPSGPKRRRQQQQQLREQQQQQQSQERLEQPTANASVAPSTRTQTPRPSRATHIAAPNASFPQHRHKGSPLAEPRPSRSASLDAQSPALAGPVAPPWSRPRANDRAP